MIVFEIGIIMYLNRSELSLKPILFTMNWALSLLLDYNLMPPLLPCDGKEREVEVLGK